ncbi:hypothetical protein H0H93_012613 [Arthromyces matolae]|nr:hypothetical protein H0H93_012613 [Arthromyces matolae]
MELGDLIFAERPAVVTPQAIPILFGIPYNASRAEFIKVQLMAFLDLYNSHTEDASGPITGRIGIDIGGDEKEVHSGSFIAASILNHSCIPNVAHWFHEASFSLRLQAVCPIKAGEELCISYVDITVPTNQRQSELPPSSTVRL